MQALDSHNSHQRLIGLDYKIQRKPHPPQKKKKKKKNFIYSERFIKSYKISHQSIWERQKARIQ